MIFSHRRTNEGHGEELSQKGVIVMDATTPPKRMEMPECTPESSGKLPSQTTHDDPITDSSLRRAAKNWAFVMTSESQAISNLGIRETDLADLVSDAIDLEKSSLGRPLPRLTRAHGTKTLSDSVKSSASKAVWSVISNVMKFGPGHLGLGIFFSIVWLLSGAVFYYYHNDWSFITSLYYSSQAGLSVGFGLVVERDELSYAYTTVHVLFGASLVAAALAIFIETILDKKVKYFDEQRLLVKLSISSADANNDGAMCLQEMQDYMSKSGRSVSVARVERMFHQADTDNSGTVEVEEFLDFLDKRKSYRRRISEFVEKHNTRVRVLIIFLVWVAGGTAYGMVHEEWKFFRSVYFAVTAMSTAGLQAPSGNDTAKLFTTFYILSGIPVFGMALGSVAGVFVDRFTEKKKNDTLDKEISEAEFAYASSLSQCNDDVDWSEFLQMEFLRLGLADRVLIDRIRAKFNRLDLNKDGNFSRAEMHQHLIKNQKKKSTKKEKSKSHFLSGVRF